MPAALKDIVEIRVHGVSGTSPESALDCPAAVQVAGDDNAGFYRRETFDGKEAPVEGGRNVEAYSWGHLTSGGRFRALWLLLLPFELVNVGFFAAVVPLGVNPDDYRVPTGPGGEGKPWRATRRMLESALRLLGLALTAWSVLAAVCVSMDIVGWQYVRRTPAETVGWLRFLHWGWLDLPERQYAITAAVPLLLVIILWLLARHTWAVLERTQVPAADPTVALQTPLEDRQMWNGERPVARLRGVHLSAALGIVAAALMMPLWQPGGATAGNLLAAVWHRPDGPAVVVVSAAIAAFLASAVVLTCLPSMTERDRPREGESPRTPRLIGRLHWLGLPLIAAALPIVVRGTYWHSVWPTAPSGPLPGLATSLDVLFAATALLLIAVAFLALMLRRAVRGAYPEVTLPDGGTGQDGATPPQAVGTPGRAVSTKPIWYGLGPAVLGTLGALVMAGGAAGLALAAARLLGHPVTVQEPGGAGGLFVPTGFEWAAAATCAAAMGAVLALLGVPVAARLRRGRHEDAARKEWSAHDLPREPEDHEIRAIARAWARADIDGPLHGLLLAAVLITVLSVAAATAGYLADPSWILSHLHVLVTLGVPALAGVVLALISLGRQAYSDPQVRRKVGILWDVAAFWPRAAHPLAPPCYMERTLPALLARIKAMMKNAGDAGGSGTGEPVRVLLSCHSQGSVIGAVVLMQLELSATTQVALLTYGSPLRRIYSRFFPAYFGRTQLERLGGYLSPGEQGARQVAPDNKASRASWRWRNLYRPSDMIGGPVFADYRHVGDRQQHDVDRWLLDPSFTWRAGDICPPIIYGHSGYPDDRGYEAALNEVTAPPLSQPRKAA